MRKKIALAVVGVLVVLLVWQWELVSYGLMQARGQVRIMVNSRPVAELMADPNYPDSLKQKLKLIAEIKRFAIDSLRLDPSGSYESFYDLQGKPLMWVLVGAERFRLVPVSFEVPILGTFSYKGFFDESRLREADSLLRKQGYDTRINEVAAYSTLGFLNDPILSNMLDRSEGSLAELIIHELTHGTLFVRDNLEYNENVADFVGEYGAERFLAQKYGRDSEQYRNYVAGKTFYERYDEHILRGTRLLDSLYQSFKPQTPVAVKDSLKWETIGQIVATSDTLTDERTQTSMRLVNKRRFSKLNLPNNAYFIGYLTYRKQQNRFRQEFENQFNSDFGRYLTHLKQTYPSL
ncbi:aminopeptidase [Spirosoma montaniterrae]|uniref:Aminopeptidase n=1 Tax=Spirosoma montaniterrae TaxID=1178516 RepID=A0A1P9WR81_9BACT|nr:aminopeptidase [Spirosoma montaniterrae]AQG77878.1 aminopeptidase [Spirosoma montaniterrae]